MDINSSYVIMSMHFIHEEKKIVNKPFLMFVLMTTTLFSSAFAHEFQKEVEYPTVTTLSQNEFDNFINNGIVVVDFYADWCVPCKKLVPIYRDLAIDFQDEVKFAKLNIDHAKPLAMKRNVSTIPTMILFRDGQEISRRGGGTKGEIEAWIKSSLNNY